MDTNSSSQNSYESPAAPVVVGKVEFAENSFNVYGGTDFGMYSSIPV